LSVDGPTTLTAAEVRVPGDPSSAAFFAVAAALVPDSNVFIEGVSLNPTRVGFIRVLERMGVSIDVLPDAASALEPMGDVRVRYSPELAATAVEAAEVPSLIDEVPVLALTAARASGTTTFEGVGELRVKESDRLTAIVRGLSKLGADASSRDDLLLVGGPATLGGAELDASGDHRLAMTWAVAGLAAEAPVGVIGFDATSVSYPGFAGDLDALRAES
jgi:3-phosphoshikimate 1-carboxyvinyltransferase